MNKKYSFLEKHIYTPNNGKRELITVWNTNSFGVVSKKEIEEAEEIIGCSFPNQLRTFYQEIGVGHLTTPFNPPAKYRFPNSNKILPPLVAAHFYQGIIEHHTVAEKEEALEYDDYWFAQSTLDIVEPGDLPFFEIGDSTTFMVMKPHSENPNAVWYMGREKVEDSFEQFIWNLYYKDPAYWEEKLS